ncbi:phage portal protein [bacterium]|nr:MAG: phage portal protein [bacterium]
MGFLDYFFYNSKPQPQQTDTKAQNAPLIYPVIGNGGVNWLNDNSQSYITNGYAGNPNVYSIIKLIIDKASTVPFNLYEVKNQSKLKSYKALSLNNNLISTKALTTKEQSLKEVENHPILDILDCPNPDQSFSDFLKNLLGYKLITGNAYIYGLSPEIGINSGKITGLSVLPSQLVSIIGTNQNIDYYHINGSNLKLSEDQVLHIKYWNPDWQNGLQLYGQSPLKAARKTIDLSNKLYDTQSSIVANKGAFGMLYDESQVLDPEQMQQLKDKFQNASPNEIMMVSAKLGWTQFGIPAEDLQLIEQQHLTLRDLCNIYQVPSILLGDDTQKTYSNYEQAEKSLIYNVIVPELTAIRDALNKWLLKQYNVSGKQYFIDFDITVLPQLAKDLTEVVAQLSQMWWITPNEKRLATNYGEDTNEPLMNRYFIPQNLVPIDEQSLNIGNNSNLDDYNSTDE